jgi:hypothetical protein
MNHKLFDSERILCFRYPKVKFDKNRANLTINKLIKIWSKEIESGNDTEVKAEFFVVFQTPQIFCDFLIEAVKNNRYALVELMTTTEYAVSENMINELFKSINLNPGKNKMELILCAQDTPTEVLKIIHYMSSDPCIDLVLNNYFHFNIKVYLEKLEDSSMFLNWDSSEPRYTMNVNHVITSTKFLCSVIENNFPNSGMIQQLTTAIGKNKDLICEYNSQALQGLPSFLNLEQSASPKPQ